MYGIESHVLSPEETKKLYPLLNTEDIYGTLYSPSDGSIDPAGFCTALTRGATKRGAKVNRCCIVGRGTYNTIRQKKKKSVDRLDFSKKRRMRAFLFIITIIFSKMVA